MNTPLLLDIFHRCPQWSKDEGICARNVNNEVQFYEGNNFGKFDQSPLLLSSQNLLLWNQITVPEIFYLAHLFFS